MPWYAPEKSATVSRPVTVRARRIAAITASDPVLQKVTRSMPVNSLIRRATSPAIGDCGPISTPLRSCSVTASVTNAGECPKRFRPNPMSMSTYSLPSTSEMREPDEPVATIGYTISFQSTRNPATTRGSAKCERCSSASLLDFMVFCV